VGDPAPLPFAPARLLALAMAAEGMRLLGAGVVRRPSEVDLAAVLAAGWPAGTGGPMAMAAASGPLVLRHDLRQAATLDAAIWADDPLLSAMIRRGTRFDALEAG
jgi:3-hydroxyacyl-CoA dehydrogenase